MMPSSLRPVGNRIASSKDTDGPTVEELAEGYRVLHLSSGTAALALAIRMACNRLGVNSPEVILPAYGCPDLVAAAVHAGARPVLADLRHDSVEYDLDALSALLSPNTAAVVAVTFLGVRPDHSTLRNTIGERNILLIEDSAQWFPRVPAQRFFGDYVVLSFGRGKPVNVLGGGALLVSPGMETPPSPQSRPAGAALIDAAQLALYNTLIHPRVYGIAERLPFLGIGLTRYHALDEIAEMGPSQRQRLPANLRRYVFRRLDVQDQWREALAGAGPDVIDLPRTHGVPADYALLRYPILMSSKTLRDQAYARLRQAGLGASIMYAQALPDIEHVGPLVTVQGEVARARDFAARLLTLPVHEDVDDATIQRAVSLLGHR
jgi:dTDP-4-amino-4,6-dideoxygalactose transaminase